MSIAWEDSYLGRIRTLAGDDPVLIMVGARCVVRDDAGRLLLIKRSDNGRWALPAGAMELGESITDCAIREVFEETGLTVTALTLVSLDTGPENVHTNMYQHTYQHFYALFRIDAWKGELVRVTDESTDAGFFAIDPEVPESNVHQGEPLLSPSTIRSLRDIAAFERTGKVLLT
jgi:ADP-ribose pyrophosphatase YjhB (NUDIX family)